MSQTLPMLAPIIAIDGTAASGKGTIARALAAQYGFAYLDTGALYRLVAWRMLQNGNAPEDEGAAVQLAGLLRRTFGLQDAANPAIRTDAVSRVTSQISAYPAVRAEMLDLQRDFAAMPPALANGPAKGAVLDGRDIGTVVCPDAPAKLFITAAVEIRARRRFAELQKTGFAATYDGVLADMRERDARDAGREVSPMKPAADAVTLDTSDMDVAQAVVAAKAAVREKISSL